MSTKNHINNSSDVGKTFDLIGSIEEATSKNTGRVYQYLQISSIDGYELGRLYPSPLEMHYLCEDSEDSNGSVAL